MRGAIAVGACVSMLSLVGCAVVPYPPDWSPVAAPGDHCAALSGEYDNTGSTVEPTNPMLPMATPGIAYLTGVLLGKGYGGVARVRLDVSPQGGMVVTELRADGTSERTVLPSQALPCHGGKIRFSSDAGVAAGGLVGVAYAGSASLSKSLDGSLIVEDFMGGAGIAIVAPVAVIARSWMRFRPWDMASPAATGAANAEAYSWPSPSDAALPPILLRESALSFYPFMTAPRNVVPRDDSMDCQAQVGDATQAALASVRPRLQAVPAVEIVERELRRHLPGTLVAAERAHPGPALSGQTTASLETGEPSHAPKVIVADVRVRFGQITQATCAVKLVATAEVRVRPAGLPEPAVPLYDVWASENVAVDAWARDPDVARETLTRLLKQVAVELAASYRNRTAFQQGPAEPSSPRR